MDTENCDETEIEGPGGFFLFTNEDGSYMSI